MSTLKHTPGYTDEQAERFRIPVNAFVEYKDVLAILVGALEGGSNYWFTYRTDLPRINWGSVKDAHPKSPYADEPLGYVYTDVMIWMKANKMGLNMWVRDEEEQDRLISDVTIRRGLETMARDYPKHYSDAFGDGEDDATTSDVLLQCICFDEVVYG